MDLEHAMLVARVFYLVENGDFSDRSFSFDEELFGFRHSFSQSFFFSFLSSCLSSSPNNPFPPYIVLLSRSGSNPTLCLFSFFLRMISLLFLWHYFHGFKDALLDSDLEVDSSKTFARIADVVELRAVERKGGCKERDLRGGFEKETKIKR